MYICMYLDSFWIPLFLFGDRLLCTLGMPPRVESQMPDISNSLLQFVVSTNSEPVRRRQLQGATQ